MDDKWIKAFTKAVAKRDFFFKPGRKTWRGVRMCISDAAKNDSDGVALGYFINIPGHTCTFNYFRSHIWGIELDLVNTETRRLTKLIDRGVVCYP